MNSKTKTAKLKLLSNGKLFHMFRMGVNPATSKKLDMTVADVLAVPPIMLGGGVYTMGSNAKGLVKNLLENKKLKSAIKASKGKPRPVLDKRMKRNDYQSGIAVGNIGIGGVMAATGAGIMASPYLAYKGIKALTDKNSKTKTAKLRLKEEIIQGIYKIASEKIKKDKTYPISRYLTWGVLPIHERAIQGRKNVGAKGVTPSEQQVLDNIKKSKDGKTYPISRYFTNPYAAGATSAVGLGLLGKVMLGNKGLLLAIPGGLFGAGSIILDREIASRAMKGRAVKGSTSPFASKRNILDQLKKNVER